MKITSKSVLVTLLLAIALISVWWVPSIDTVQSSTTSQILITKKYEDNHQYWIQGYDPERQPKQDVTINIPDRNVWRLLNEHQVYAMTYFYKKNHQHPVFEEIVPESH